MTQLQNQCERRQCSSKELLYINFLQKSTNENIISFKLFWKTRCHKQGNKNTINKLILLYFFLAFIKLKVYIFYVRLSDLHCWEYKNMSKQCLNQVHYAQEKVKLMICPEKYEGIYRQQFQCIGTISQAYMSVIHL